MIYLELKRNRKIILLGRAGTGKTSIKKLLFEGVQPDKLLTNPLEPTRGIISKVYRWLDLNLGVFDTSGQELPFLLQNPKEQEYNLQNTDSLIYIIDYPRWTNDYEEICEEIRKIKDILTQCSIDAKLSVFFHKIDLIPNEFEESINNQLNMEIKYKLGLSYYLTSLHPQFSYTLYGAFYQIISGFSQETHHLKIIIDDMIKDLSETMCFVTNKNNSIVVQTMTKDFDIKLINDSHNLIAQLNKSFEEMMYLEKLGHVIISSNKSINIILKNLQIKKFNLKNIICISKKLGANRLILLIGKIKLIFNQYVFRGSYNLGAKNENENDH